jgi:PleD family two-component response regulator
MVVAVVDDLMFSSKLRAAAAAAGATLQFARSHEAALTMVGERRPSLVILDLDNPRTDPLGLIAAWRQHSDTATLPIIGFVSHVRADLIDAARTAGITELLARSGFVRRLDELMAGAAATAATSLHRLPDEPPPRQ